MSELRGPWIVAGMHRSGTSLVASALTAAGVDMGERLLAGDTANPPGYFEDLDVLELDRRVLAAAVPPDDGGHPDWGWTESERLDAAALAGHGEAARALVAARRATGRPWGFKDPRATLLLDSWLAAAPEARFLLVYRLPWEVADSMQRLGAEVFLRHPDYAYRIWAFYNARLLDFRRRHRERCLLVSTDAAVEDTPRFAALLRERLGLDGPADALAGRFDPALLHRLPAADPLVALVGVVYPECAELLAALDAEADLPAAGLWRRDPPRPPAPVAEPRVAVVVPCFEHGDFAVEAVASVERSVDVPYELVVVDDGSTAPRTRAVLGRLRDAGYAVEERPHRGVAAARNYGFAATRAPYVIPLDADNQLLPGFVAAALDLLEATPEAAAVYGDRLEVGLRSRRVEVGEFDPDLLVAANYVDTCAVVRRRAWEDCGGYDETMPAQGYEDWELWLAVVSRGWTLRWLPLPSFVYRVRPGSMLALLDTSPDLAVVQRYIDGKHGDLVRGALRHSVAVLADSRRDREADRALVAETAARLAAAETELAAAQADLRRGRDELTASRAELAAQRDALARGEAELAATGRAREEVAAACRDALATVERLSGERDALERQARLLHDALAAWRARLAEAEAPRSARLRAGVVRLRSVVERRPRTGSAGPCVIGATGGSGTRVFARLAADAGLHLGGERNPYEDALPIERFLDRWLLPFWEGGGWRPPHPAPPGMDEDFRVALREQLAARDPADQAPWGWKAPRSLYLLPFLAQRFPDLRFLHVVRDGRDMALSTNQLQLGRYGAHLLPDDCRGWGEAERSIALWSLLNTTAADHGTRLGRAYLRMRFEDLCARPTAVSRQVVRLFDLPGSARRAARLVEPPATLGRWRRADPALVARLEEIGGAALRRFGYAPPRSPG